MTVFIATSGPTWLRGKAEFKEGWAAQLWEDKTVLFLFSILDNVPLSFHHDIYSPVSFSLFPRPSSGTWVNSAFKFLDFFRMYPGTLVHLVSGSGSFPSCECEFFIRKSRVFISQHISSSLSCPLNAASSPQTSSYCLLCMSCSKWLFIGIRMILCRDIKIFIMDDLEVSILHARFFQNIFSFICCTRLHWWKLRHFHLNGLH